MDAVGRAVDETWLTTKLRYEALTRMAADMPNVIARADANEATTADRKFMTFALPSTIVLSGRPARGIDMSALTLDDGAALMKRPLVKG